MQRTYPRWPLKNFMCGFSAMIFCTRSLVSAPSPPEVIEVPTNSVPTVGEPGSLKSDFRSATQLLWTSPVMTTGLPMRRSAMKPMILFREPRYPAQAFKEPLLLRLSGDRAGRVTLFGVGGIYAAARGLIVPVLAGVQNVKLGEVSVCYTPVEAHVRTLRYREGTERQVLVVRLIRGRSTPEELLDRPGAPGCTVGVIVLDLVVVPGHDPGKGRVRRPQVTGTAIEGVPVAVLRERVDFRTVVPTHVAARGNVLVYAVLVDVVAEVHDEVQVLLADVAVGGVVAVLVHLAGGEGEAHLRNGGPTGGRRLGPSYRAHLGARLEAVEVLSRRLEPFNSHVHRVRQLGRCKRRTPAHDLAKVFVGGYLPLHANVLHWHPAVSVLRKRFGGEPRPQHHPIGQRIARGDT